MTAKLAAELHRTSKPSPASGQLRAVAAPVRPMTKDFQVRFTAVVLAVLTVAAATLAWINLQKQSEFQVPYDGAWWVERDGRLVAGRIDPDGPAQRAGIKAGDQLTGVDGVDIKGMPALERQLYRDGVWSKARYRLVRQSIPLETELVLTPADRSLYLGLRLIAVFYLGIGLYVLLRRWTAPKSTHFFIFCLVSFILYSFKYTGKLNDFDWIIYWSSVVAGLLQPALFLHFVLTFPEKKHFVARHPWVQPAVYVPGLLLVALHLAVLRTLQASELLRWNLDRLEMLYLATFFVVAAGLLWHSYRVASTTILRQQMKWVTRGTILAITPFTLFYLIPYLQGTLPTMYMMVSVP